MKTFKTVLFLLLVGVVGFVAAIADADCLSSPTSASTDAPFPSVSSGDGTISTHPILNVTHLPSGNLSHFARRNTVPHPRPLPIMNITATPDISETASATVVSPLAHSVTSDNDTATVVLTVTAQSTVFVDLEDPSNNQTVSSSLTSSVAADETASGSSSLSSSVSVATASTSGMMNNVTTTSTLSSIIASKTTTVTVQTAAASATSMSSLMSAALSTYAGAQSVSSSSTHAVDAVSLSAVATILSLNHSSGIASELATSPVTSLVNTLATEHHTFPSPPHFVNISTFVASGLHISSMAASTSNNGSDTLSLPSSPSSGSVDTSFPIIVSTAVQESNHHTTRHAASSTTVSTVTAAASTTTTTGAAARVVQPPRVFAHIAHVALVFVNAIKLTHADVTANVDAGSGSAPAPASAQVPAPCGNANNATLPLLSFSLYDAGSGQDITATISMTQTHYSTTTVHATRTLTATRNTTAIVKTPSMAHPTSSMTTMTATKDSSASVLALSAVGSLLLVGLGFWFIF